MVALAGLGAAGALALRGGSLAPGERLGVEVGIVAADLGHLGCAGDVEGASCEWDANEKPRSANSRLEGGSPLRPFVTISGQLIVMSGLFESEGVVAWLATATDARVKVRCSATVIATAAPVKLRFRATDAFGTHQVPVLRGQDCSVVP